MFIKVTGKCPHCEVRKHQIDSTEERAMQIVGDAIERHVSEAHPDPGFEARRATAGMVIPASIRALDALTDPVSRAVLDLHRRHTDWDNAPTWGCAVCVSGDYPTDWPCSTVAAVAAGHGIDLADDFLFSRPTDGSLDQPDAAEPCPNEHGASAALVTPPAMTPTDDNEGGVR